MKGCVGTERKVSRRLDGELSEEAFHGESLKWLLVRAPNGEAVGQAKLSRIESIHCEIVFGRHAGQWPVGT